MLTIIDAFAARKLAAFFEAVAAQVHRDGLGSTETVQLIDLAMVPLTTIERNAVGLAAIRRHLGDEHLTAADRSYMLRRAAQAMHRLAEQITATLPNPN